MNRSSQSTRVLVVEDDPDIAMLLARSLTRAGFAVDHVSSGADVKSDVYIAAMRQLAQSRRDILKVFRDVDLLVLPTMADPPFKIEEGLKNNVSARNTLPFDVYGIPMISIPCGFTKAGLPIGLQIAGAPWAESTILALAQAYEQATEWHTRHPKLG